MSDYYDILSRLKKTTLDAQAEMNGVPDKAKKPDLSKLVQKPVVRVNVRIGNR